MDTKRGADNAKIVLWWIGSQSEDVWDIFSPFVWYEFSINWWKIFHHSTICASAVSLFVSKLWGELALRIMEIFSPKFFGGLSRPIIVTPWQDLEIALKKWHFEIFGTCDKSRGNRLIHALVYTAKEQPLVYSISIIIYEM